MPKKVTEWQEILRKRKESGKRTKRNIYAEKQMRRKEIDILFVSFAAYLLALQWNIYRSEKKRRGVHFYEHENK